MIPTDPDDEYWSKIAAIRDDDLASGRVEPVLLEDAIRRIRTRVLGLAQDAHSEREHDASS